MCNCGELRVSVDYVQMMRMLQKPEDRAGIDNMLATTPPNVTYFTLQACTAHHWATTTAICYYEDTGKPASAFSCQSANGDICLTPDGLQELAYRIEHERGSVVYHPNASREGRIHLHPAYQGPL